QELLPHPTLLGTRSTHAAPRVDTRPLALANAGTARGHRAPELSAAPIDAGVTRRSGPPAPDALGEVLPTSPQRSGAQRALVVLLCFVLGAGAALGIATRLGAFSAAARSAP